MNDFPSVAELGQPVHVQPNPELDRIASEQRRVQELHAAEEARRVAVQRELLSLSAQEHLIDQGHARSRRAALSPIFKALAVGGVIGGLLWFCRRFFHA